MIIRTSRGSDIFYGENIRWPDARLSIPLSLLRFVRTNGADAYDTTLRINADLFSFDEGVVEQLNLFDFFTHPAVTEDETKE